jgi:hypothetical protein
MTFWQDDEKAGVNSQNSTPNFQRNPSAAIFCILGVTMIIDHPVA